MEIEEHEHRKKFRCLFGFAHALLATKVILGYFVVWNLVLSQLVLPPISFYYGVFGLAFCVITSFGIVVKSPHIMVAFYLYVSASLLFLLYLGGYFFFVNIFYKEEVKAAFGEKFDDLSILCHLFDVLLLIVHYYCLGIVFKCRKYFSYLKSNENKLCEVVPMRSETKEDFA